MHKVLKTLLLCLALIANLALAQGEPSMSEIYAAAQAGQIDKAQSLVQQVLITHPNSAKAHFVRAELFAKEGKYRLAQEALSEAERLSPGLPFAKPDAVTALKAQIGGSRMQPAHVTPQHFEVRESQNSNWLLLLVAAGGVIAAGYFLFRNRQPQPSASYGSTAAYQGNALSGPQTFGANPNTGYPTPMPPSEPSMGSRIMGGVATGLAVGAGVVAAEAIGRRLMGHDEHSSALHDSLGAGSDFTPITANPDMGGDNFGIADTSWDDAGQSSAGSDWDN